MEHQPKLMSDNSKTILTFLLGAAAGIAIGFYIASDNKEEIISDLKDAGKRIKENLGEEIEKGKKFVDEIKSKVNDLLNA